MEEVASLVTLRAHESWERCCDAVERRNRPLGALLRRIIVDAPVVLGFAFLCCAVSVLDALTPGALSVALACPPRRLLSRSPLGWYPLATHVLGHANYAHLKGNMINLLLVGPAAEREFGSASLLKIGVYVALSSAVAHMVLGPADAYQLGASGVVFALILLNSLLSASTGTVPLTFLITALLWLSDEVFAAVLSRDSSVSHVAHLTGACVGTVAGYALHADQERRAEAAAARKWWFARTAAKPPSPRGFKYF